MYYEKRKSMKDVVCFPKQGDFKFDPDNPVVAFQPHIVMDSFITASDIERIYLYGYNDGKVFENASYGFGSDSFDPNLPIYDLGGEVLGFSFHAD